MQSQKTQHDPGTHPGRDTFAVTYRMRGTGIAIGLMGVAAAAAGGSGWWLAVGAWLTAASLVYSQSSREEQVSEQLRRELSPAGEKLDLQAFAVIWKREGNEGVCFLSSLESAQLAAKRLFQSQEARGSIECYEMTSLPEIGRIPTAWFRWNPAEETWTERWSADRAGLTVIASTMAAKAAAEAQAAASYWPMT